MQHVIHFEDMEKMPMSRPKETWDETLKKDLESKESER